MTSPSSPPPPSAPGPDRRRFLAVAGSCVAHLTLLGAGGIPWRWGSAVDRARIRAQEPWGTLAEVADGVWALISAPMADRTTLCNGGIVAGRSGVAVVEAFASPRGAGWMAEQARRLTGRAPDVVVVTHHHGDHSAGLPGFGGDSGPEPRMTGATAARIREGLEGAEAGRADAMAAALDRARVIPDPEGERLDLGGRTIRLAARRGHTASDVTVEQDEPPVVFCGDLVWNGMFPNYVDARPSALSAAVADLPVAEGSVLVPGHGPLGDPAALARYREVLDAVEDHARRAAAAGRTAAEAARDLALPDHAAEWTLFSPSYFERALEAWLRDLAEE